MNTAQTITPQTQSFSLLTRIADVILAVILAAAVGLGASYAIDQLRTSDAGAPSSHADGFSTQSYAELSALRGFSTQDYASRHVAPAKPAAAQGFSTQDYAAQHD